MAAPSPRSHRCRSVAAQPGCGTAPAPQHGSRRSRRVGRRGWAGGGGLPHAPAILESCARPPSPSSAAPHAGTQRAPRSEIQPCRSRAQTKGCAPLPTHAPAVPSMVTDVWLSFESLGPFTFSSWGRKGPSEQPSAGLG